MVSIKWCWKQSKGLALIKPNMNLAESYLKLAEASIGTMNRERDKNLVFSISAGYYSIYYSLYSILMALGIKCEIHQCTIKFCEKFLNEFFTKQDFKIINDAFKLRNVAQYYVDKIIDNKEINLLIKNAPYFVAKSKDVLIGLNENNIKEIRTKFKQEIFAEEIS